MPILLPRLALLLAGLAAGAALAQAPEKAGPPRPAFDPYDPARLNEAAADAVRRGDVTTAWILLERAARLAPHDARIVHNARELRAYREGRRAPAEAPPAPATSSPPAVPAEPPALWPAK